MRRMEQKTSAERRQIISQPRHDALQSPTGNCRAFSFIRYIEESVLSSGKNSKKAARLPTSGFVSCQTVERDLATELDANV